MKGISTLIFAAFVCSTASSRESWHLTDSNVIHDKIEDIESYPTGEPDCDNYENWNKAFSHNWYFTYYWKCNSDMLELHVCPNPKVFQESLSTCVYPWNWSCDYDGVDETTEPTTEIESEPTDSTTSGGPTTPPSWTLIPEILPTPSCDNPRCDGIWDRLLQPHRDPRRYYTCVLSRPVERSCSLLGTDQFNYDHQICVPRILWRNSCDLEN